jgi:signal transduction histidine kinase
LRPTVLDTQGILEALEWHVQEFEDQFDIPTVFYHTLEELELGPEKSLAVFRIVQESLTNSARHGLPTKIHVSAEKSGGNLIITVSDNGHGFDYDSHDESSTFGLLSMRERAKQCGGSLSIRSSPGHGTEITVTVPFGEKR